ncbi:Diacylglycerol O-acyltransferase 2 [Entophlyctis luteolus]|nr:Diacylglycerol O-acyltransferase 2 [Entophlyctis luteolus]
MQSPADIARALAKSQQLNPEPRSESVGASASTPKRLVDRMISRLPSSAAKAPGAKRVVKVNRSTKRMSQIASTSTSTDVLHSFEDPIDNISDDHIPSKNDSEVFVIDSDDNANQPSPQKRGKIETKPLRLMFSAWIFNDYKPNIPGKDCSLRARGANFVEVKIDGNIVNFPELTHLRNYCPETEEYGILELCSKNGKIRCYYLASDEARGFIEFFRNHSFVQDRCTDLLRLYQTLTDLVRNQQTEIPADRHAFTGKKEIEMDRSSQDETVNSVNSQEIVNSSPQEHISEPQMENSSTMSENEIVLIYPASGVNCVTLHRDDLTRLREGEFLNDTLIEFYIRWSTQTYALDKIPLGQFHIFNTFFYQQLTAADETRGAKKRIGADASVGLHWYLAVLWNPGGFLLNGKKESIFDLEAGPIISSDECKIFIFDSLDGKHPNVSKVLSSYLRLEAREKLQKDCFEENIKIVYAKVQPQLNYCDCGIFLCHYITLMLRCPDLVSQAILNRVSLATPEFGSLQEIRAIRRFLRSKIEELSLVQRLEKEGKIMDAALKRIPSFQRMQMQMPPMPQLPPMPKFAPINVPFPRRRQTAMVAFWMILVPLFLFLFLEMLLFSHTRTIALVYFLYVLSDKTHEKGARRSETVRRFIGWTWFRDFFPISLRKEVDLDPSKKYIFAYHPHGIISLGAFTSFATEACNISKLFPGLNIRLLTLESNFRIPFWRDLLLALNVASADKSSINYILSNKGVSRPGDSLALVVGGAAEALEARPRETVLVLKTRMGFVKLAIVHGASLVPVFGFGENDVWDQVPNPHGSVVRRFQTMFKDIASFSPVLFHGRGIFTYDYGILPYRKAITVVVGKPIDVVQNETPTDEEIKKYHALYVEGLKELYDRYKDELLPDRKSDLKII